MNKREFWTIIMVFVLCFAAGFAIGYGSGYFSGVKWSVHLAGVALDRGALHIEIDEDLITQGLVAYKAQAELLISEWNVSNKLNFTGDSTNGNN